MTREVKKSQMEIGELPIAQITFDPKSRDDIPKILKGLQYIYITDAISKPLFALLAEKFLPEVNKKIGRPGMDLWKILVMGVLRLDLNCDYDRVHELVNRHDTVRQMLGHSDVFDKYQYNLQTIKDNVKLLTPEILDEVNQLIVRSGHQLLGKKKELEPLRGRCDSFVVETNVHYPTDINLLYDATRKVIQLTAVLSDAHQLSDWRQQAYNVKQVKRQMRICQKKKRSSEKNGIQSAKGTEKKQQAYQELLKIAQKFLDRSAKSCAKISQLDSFKMKDLALREQINDYTRHAERQIDQISRRVLQDEVIPHAEKVFSIFQPHTEWISKGKAGVPVELGLRVCILEDHHQFILSHKVMEKETDSQIAIQMITKTKAAFPSMTSCSFDKGFHSLENQIGLQEHLEVVGLKRKGKLSQKNRAIESSVPFKKAQHKHSAVESAINGLEVHGLDRCRDHGIQGFKQYVAWAIVTRNIHRIGAILSQKEQKKIARQKHRWHYGGLALAS